jgi:hypothetical protein
MIPTTVSASVSEQTLAAWMKGEFAETPEDFLHGGIGAAT